MIKARVVMDVMVEDEKENGYINIYLTKENITFSPSKETKIICFSSEIYPNVKIVMPTPSNKVGELEDERSDPDKTDIH